MILGTTHCVAWIGFLFGASAHQLERIPGLPLGRSPSARPEQSLP